MHVSQAGDDVIANLLPFLYLFAGVDEVTIVNILTNRSNEQRQDIAFAYQRRTKKVPAKWL